MKPLINSLLFVVAVFLLSTCDEVEAPYLIPVGGNDTAECPLPEFQHVHDPVKRVLLEDYTGHTCVNCPSAAVIAHDLNETLGNRLVVVAVHAGFFAMPLGGEYSTDFRTEAGTAWDSFFGISAIGNPNGMVDRTGYSGNHVLSPGAWSARINEQLAKEPELVIQIINEFTTSSSKLCTHIQVVFEKELDRNLNLCIVLTENEVIAPQKNNNPNVGPTPDIMDYEHNNLLRGAVNAPWGVAISSMGEAIPIDTKITKSYKVILDDDWDPYKCMVVAFVYDHDTYEVLQVSEEPVQ
jgi:hypothetical protein